MTETNGGLSNRPRVPSEGRVTEAAGFTLAAVLTALVLWATLGLLAAFLAGFLVGLTVEAFEWAKGMIL